jgi:hypothetical protein
MLGRLICCVVVGTCLASSALATGTVSLLLESSAAGQTISAGTTVNWSVKVSVSTGDNVGLALIACDLVQSASNPAKFSMPPGVAASIPAAMAKFNRPAGIANPGEGAEPSGYVGVQRGTAGQMNLVQIGGAQNTFGTAMSPGSGIGENAVVTSGIGQGGSAQLVLSGSFPAPATEGSYTFSLQNGVANVLTSVGTPPAFSPVSSATVNLAGASFTFAVGQTVCHGDMNCDGTIGFADINPFVLNLSNFASWQSTYAGCSSANGDINGDGTYPGFSDINPFVSLLSQSPAPTCP